MDEREQTYDLGAFGAMLRRRLVLIVGLGLLFAAVAFVATAAKPDRYEATSVLLFRDSGLDQQILGRPNLFGGEQLFDADTNVGLASLDIVTERATERLAREGSPAVDEAAGGVEVREGAGPELVEITAATERAEDSAAVANAYAEAFIDFRRSSDREAFERTREAIRGELEAGAGPDELDQAELERLRDQLAELRALELLQTGDVELVERAEVPVETANASPLRSAALGGFAGLIVGVVVAVLLEGADPRLRSRRDYERGFGASIVGTPSRGSLSDPDPRDYQGPFTRLSFSGGERRQDAWLVTSALDAGAEHSSIALGLARAATASGLRVALVEAELSAPTLAARVGTEPSPGLAELLEGRADGRSIRRVLSGERDASEGITLVPAGAPHANPAALLADRRIGELLVDLRSEHDLVIVDGPRIGPGAEVVPVAAAVSGIVLATSEGASAAEVELVRTELEPLAAPLLGVIRVSDR